MNKKNQQSIEINKKRRPRPDELDGVQQRLRSERVELALRQLPGWKLVAAGKAIGRTWRFPEPQVAAAYVAYVANLAATVHQPVRMHLDGNVLSVTVSGINRNGNGEGLTRQVVQLAQNLA